MTGKFRHETLAVILACACLIGLFPHANVHAADQPPATETIPLADPQNAPIIVVGEQPEDQVRYAIEDLQHYLRRITGQNATLVRIKPDAQQAGVPIYIGDVPANEDLKKVVAVEQLGRDGFVLDISAKGVRILGGSKFGTAYGVYELLERCGVRWLFPGEWGDVVPTEQTLTLKAGRSIDRPVFEIREMHTAYVGKPFGDWARRQRHNRAGFFGHSSLIVKKYRQDHPEWFAEIDGQRQNMAREPKLCHSNQSMVKQAIDDVMEQIRTREADLKTRSHVGYRHLAKDYFIISISPTDGGDFCRCAECLKMGTISDRLQTFANTIADAVRRVYPRYSVGYYGAYSEAHMPPTVKAHPGVVVFFTTWQKDHFAAITASPNAVFRKKIEGFVETCPSLAVRDFDGLAVWWGHGPMSRIDVLVKDYPWYDQHGIKGVTTEAHIGSGPWGQSYYVLSRLWWNPYADVEAIKRDFVQTGFGEAFEPMWRYYERLNQARVYPPPATLYAMRMDLDEASQIAKRADVRRRIDYLRAYYLLYDTSIRIKSGQANQDEIRIAWRVAGSIDYHVTSLNEAYFRKQSGVGDDERVKPFTPDELKKMLDGVTLEKPAKALRRWSDADDLRLVPVSRKDAEFSSGMGVHLRYGPHKILILASKGERIHIWQEGKSKTQYELRGPEQSVLVQGMAEGKTIVDRPAGTAGIYTLTYSTGGSRPQLHVSNPFAVIKADNALQNVHIYGHATLYFYVPDGTKEFSVTGKGDGGELLVITVWGPHDAELPVYPRTIQQDRRFKEHRIQVPQGADGKVWKMQVQNTVGEDKKLFLSGIPPFLASHPARLLKRPNSEIETEHRP